MPNYSTYTLNLERNLRMLRQYKLIPSKERGLPALKKAIQLLHLKHPQIAATLDFIIHIEEYNWLTTGRTVYFPESVEQAYSMLNAKITIKDFNSLFDGVESFILTAPKDFYFSKDVPKTISALLVTINPVADIQKNIVDPFREFINCGELVHEIGDWHPDDIGISICYQNDPINDKFLYSRCQHSGQFITDLLSSNNFEEFQHKINEANKFDYLGGIGSDEEDLRIQYSVMRYIVNFLLYKKALPERIKPGLPQQFAKINTSRDFPKNKPLVLMSPKRDGVEAQRSRHYRSMHFRQLMNEKYYRGEHKDKKIGSRIVLVSDSFVGSKVYDKEAEAYTIT